MARTAFRSAALGILAAVAAAPVLTAGGSLRGSVMERERADGGRSLGVTISSEVLEEMPTTGRSFDELVLLVPKATARDLEVGHAPRGWERDPSFRSGLRLRGPAIEAGDFRLDAPRSWQPPARLEIDCRFDGRSVFNSTLPVEHRPRVWNSTDHQEWQEFPHTLRAGAEIRMDWLMRDKLGLGLSWKLESADPYLDFGFERRGDQLVGTVPDPFALRGWDSHQNPFYPHRRPHILVGVDRWGETWVRDELQFHYLPGTDHRISPPGTVGGGQPRFDAATEIIAPNSQLCICGQTPDLGAWDHFTLGGIQLGRPSFATGTSAIYPLPKGLPVGLQPIEFQPWLDGGRSTGLGTTSIEVRGDVARDVLRRGGSTPLTLEIVGTDRVFPVVLDNGTPSIIELEGGVHQELQTSGGAANKIVRTVTGLQVGDFKVNYRVALPTCPCDEEGQKVSETCGDEFVELLEGWDSELDGSATGAPTTKQELLDSFEPWRLRASYRYEPGEFETGEAAAALPKPFENAGCRPADRPLTLLNDRFQVQVGWNTDAPAQSAVCPQPDRDDSGVLYFFHPDNWALIVKVLDACERNDRFWVFGAATTDVDYTLSVTDTKSGETKQYSTSAGGFRPVIDTSAFATCP